MMWPIHGYYRCFRCHRAHPVCWEAKAAVRVKASGIASLAFVLLAGAIGCWGQTPPAPAAATLAYVAPTQSERLQHYLKSLVSPEAIARSAAGAGLQQLNNTPIEWGQGADGYLRRFANGYGEHLIRQTFLYGLSDALGEDNHYIRSERHGVGPRVMYAVESTFLARRSDGARRVSYSRLGAVLATAFISRAWQPPSTSGPEHAIGSFGTTMGTEIGFNVFRELVSNPFQH